MQRRELLEKMISTAIAMGLASPGLLASAQASEAAAEGPKETARWLERELRLLAAKDSSEQSTPMFLALENLATDASPGTAAISHSNPELVAQFEHYADLLLQYKSNPDESDAVALIELMAGQELVPDTAAVCR